MRVDDVVLSSCK